MDLDDEFDLNIGEDIGVDFGDIGLDFGDKEGEDLGDISVEVGRDAPSAYRDRLSVDSHLLSRGENEKDISLLSPRSRAASENPFDGGNFNDFDMGEPMDLDIGDIGLTFGDDPPAIEEPQEKLVERRNSTSL